MAIQSISQVYCSLNLGYVYNVSYDYSPKDGATITLFFVTQDGIYRRPIAMQTAQIRIGNASFTMTVVSSDIQLSSGRRVMSVEFVDQMFQLDWYQVVLTGKGCGFRVFPLGVPVDTRTPEQKQADALDPVAQQIAEFTTFPDVEYAFNDFLTILRQKFAVQANVPYNATVTNPFVGSFREVLDQWCSFFNLSWFIENSIIKIFNPVTLHITLPDQPLKAIEYSSLEDIRSTYGKTCYNWFQQEGGEFPLNQTSNTSGPLLVRSDTLYPLGYEFNLPQTPMDLNQVAAAQFGQPFWFLYNYSLGTTQAQCGWNLTPNASTTIYQAVQAVAGTSARIASVNQTAYDERFQAYKTYGENIAGRWYLSYEKGSLAVDQGYTWFDESDGDISTFVSLDNRVLDPVYLTPTSEGVNVIPSTSVNVFYSGVNYVGNRIAYQDTTTNATQFVLTDAQQALVNNVYQAITIEGSQSMDFGAVPGSPDVFVGFNPVVLPQDLSLLFGNMSALTTGYAPRFTSLPIKGVRQLDYSTLKASQSEPNNVEIVTDNAGGTIVSNTAVIKTLKQGTYTVYYDKYSQCASANSTGPYFQHLFDPRQISPDNTVQFTFNKQAANTYQLSRDFSTINALVNNPLLPLLAQPRSFPTKKVTFTVNYFYDVPTNFLTNGLVGLSVAVGDNGVTASYTYSNEVLQIPNYENRFAQYEQQIRNSAIRHYTPTSVIT